MRLSDFLLENTAMLNLPATTIAGRPGWWSICALVLLVHLLSIGCVDQAAIDDRECQSKGFKEDANEYAYCRAKLQQLRDEGWRGRQRLRELMSG